MAAAPTLRSGSAAVPCAGGRGPSGVLGKISGLAAEGPFNAVGEVRVATIQNFGEQVSQEADHVRGRADNQIGRAILLIHRDPAHPWTLAALASAVAMSRSAFAARFAARVGVPAMQYVTSWRMNTALTHLKEQNVSVAAVAERLGYQSEAAFSRTFKRVIGASPGSVRRQQ